MSTWPLRSSEKVCPGGRGAWSQRERGCKNLDTVGLSGLGATWPPEWPDQSPLPTLTPQGRESKLSTNEGRVQAPAPGPQLGGQGWALTAVSRPALLLGSPPPHLRLQMREQLFKPLGGLGDKEVQ